MSIVEIDGVKYEPVMLGGRRQIVICQRGFIYVGIVEDADEEVIIRDAACVRRWGTEKGLGQLASEGPQDNTILDPCPTVRVHPLAIVNRIDCVEESWSK